jgi:hypothetical protein
VAHTFSNYASQETEEGTAQLFVTEATDLSLQHSTFVIAGRRERTFFAEDAPHFSYLRKEEEGKTKSFDVVFETKGGKRKQGRQEHRTRRRESCKIMKRN